MPKRFPAFALFTVTFFGSWLVTCVLHEPAPRVHDEFSYLLMADTFATGRISNPTPPLTEFFDTFHVLMHPAYVSKYFIAQGLFLALGEQLTGHPVVGVWLSSALASAATYWMLEAWIGTSWALFGAILMVLECGIYGYWSQSYWGGMVAALGGALLFGGARRLWDRFSWTISVCFAFGIVILVNSRPLEGLISLLPLTTVLTIRFARQRVWQASGFWLSFVFPTLSILSVGAFLTAAYNRTITGSFWKPPYIVHEQQYQETPQFAFLPLRPKITYSSPWVQYYYDHWEMQRYERQRDPKLLISVSSGKIVSWWYFFCGILLTPCLISPGLLSNNLRIRYAQGAIALLLPCLWIFSSPESFVLRGLFLLLCAGQVVVLWKVLDNLWARLAVFTLSLLLLETCIIKWFFPHYVAPAACLILFLQVAGARRIWDWKRASQGEQRGTSRSQQRRVKRERPSTGWLVSTTRGYVRLLPVLCAVSLVLRVEARLNGWKLNEMDTDNLVLPIDDWSSHRAAMERWLNERPGPQLVFVAYSGHHNVNFEWVYNHADLVHSHVIWARNLGPEHNRLLLKQFPDRTAWVVEADRRDPQLIPYSAFDGSITIPVAAKADATEGKEFLNW